MKTSEEAEKKPKEFFEMFYKNNVSENVKKGLRYAKQKKNKNHRGSNNTNKA